MTTFLMLALLVLPIPEPPTASRVRTYTHYALELPPGYTVMDVSPPHRRFLTYHLVGADGNLKCGLYIGNRPPFPFYSDWGSVPMIKSSDANRTKRAYQSAHRMEGLLEFSGLTYRGQPSTQFSKVEYYCVGLTPADVKDLSAMVESIHVVQKDLK